MPQNTGESAVTLALRSRLNLVLLDLGLPGMRALDVLATLRNDARTADLPVVVLSDRHETKLIDRALALGATDYLIKTNTTPAQVSQSIHRWVRTHRARPVDVTVGAEAQTVTGGANGGSDG